MGPTPFGGGGGGGEGEGGGRDVCIGVGQFLNHHLFFDPIFSPLLIMQTD